MSLVKRVAFTKWAPQATFGAKSIFRLCLFLDMLIILYELQYAICGWLVKLEKYMDFYFYTYWVEYIFISIMKY